MDMIYSISKSLECVFFNSFCVLLKLKQLLTDSPIAAVIAAAAALTASSLANTMCVKPDHGEQADTYFSD